MKVKKRVIFSRHGMRYPFFNCDEYMKKSNINKSWTIDEGLLDKLTTKGELIEYRFGQELKNIFNLKNDDKVKFMCSSTKRTFNTAKILSTAMYPYKDIDIDCKDREFNSFDKRFDISFTDNSILNNNKIEALEEKFKPIYEKIESVLGYEKGGIFNEKSTIYLQNGDTLRLSGAMDKALDFSDTFVIKYYMDFKEDDIFNSDNFINDLKEISTIKDDILEVIYTDEDYIRNSVKNPLQLIEDALKDENDLTVIVGHDINLACIMSQLGIDFNIEENSLEKYPIGAKLVLEVMEDQSIVYKFVYFDYKDIRDFGISKPIVKELKISK